MWCHGGLHNRGALHYREGMQQPLKSDPTANAETSELLGSSEACKILGIDRSSLVRRAQLGRMPIAMKLPGPNGVYLFHRADVMAALAAERSKSPVA